MIDYTEGCQPAEKEQQSEPAPANRQNGRPRQAKTPYAIIWKDGMELELY